MALDTEKLLEQASQAVREAGELFARRDMAGHIRQKGATDFVTQVDLEVQTMLQKRLAEIAPEVQFMGEEKDNSQVDLSGAVWILDPVDGTTNLIHGYCHSAVSGPGRGGRSDHGPHPRPLRRGTVHRPKGTRSLLQRTAHPRQRGSAPQ